MAIMFVKFFVTLFIMHKIKSRNKLSAFFLIYSTYYSYIFVVKYLFSLYLELSVL